MGFSMVEGTTRLDGLIVFDLPRESETKLIYYLLEKRYGVSFEQVVEEASTNIE